MPVGNYCICFFKLFEQSLLLFCESGSEFRFKPHNGFEKFAFVRAVGYGVFVRINVAVIQIFKCVHGFHPFPSQTPYHSPCRKSSTFQNKKAATVSDSRRVDFSVFYEDALFSFVCIRRCSCVLRRRSWFCVGGFGLCCSRSGCRGFGCGGCTFCRSAARRCRCSRCGRSRLG